MRILYHVLITIFSSIPDSQRHFGYDEISFDKVKIKRDDPVPSRGEGALFAEVLWNSIADYAVNRPALHEIFGLWRRKFEAVNIHIVIDDKEVYDKEVFDKEAEDSDVEADKGVIDPQCAAAHDDDDEPLFSLADAEQSDIHTWDSYVAAFSKDAGKDTAIVWWDALFGQIKWAHRSTAFKRIAFERLGKKKNIFVDYIEVDGIIVRVGNKQRPVTTHMVFEDHRTKDKTIFGIVLAIYITVDANPVTYTVTARYIRAADGTWSLGRIQFDDFSIPNLGNEVLRPELRPPSSAQLDADYNRWLDENDKYFLGHHMIKQRYMPHRFILNGPRRDPSGKGVYRETFSEQRVFQRDCFSTRLNYSSCLASDRPLARPPPVTELSTAETSEPADMRSRVKNRSGVTKELRTQRQQEKTRRDEEERKTAASIAAVAAQRKEELRLARVAKKAAEKAAKASTRRLATVEARRAKGKPLPPPREVQLRAREAAAATTATTDADADADADAAAAAAAPADPPHQRSPRRRLPTREIVMDDTTAVRMIPGSSNRESGRSNDTQSPVYDDNNNDTGFSPGRACTDGRNTGRDRINSYSTVPSRNSTDRASHSQSRSAYYSDHNDTSARPQRDRRGYDSEWDRSRPPMYRHNNQRSREHEPRRRSDYDDDQYYTAPHPRQAHNNQRSRDPEQRRRYDYDDNQYDDDRGHEHEPRGRRDHDEDRHVPPRPPTYRHNDQRGRVPERLGGVPRERDTSSTSSRHSRRQEATARLAHRTRALEHERSDYYFIMSRVLSDMPRGSH